MYKWLRVVLTVVAVMLIASPVLAQEDGGNAAVQQARDSALIYFTSAFGAGLVILGAAWGIGRIGSAAVESMARQPEVAGNIQTAMIIAAALIEGATFFGLIVCMLFNN